ncbi:IS1182 family transposase [Phascolarctobacterium sp.]
MLVKEENERNILEFVNMEELIPSDHVLRKIDAAIDFSKIYDLVEDLYCQDNGRPSIDPVVLFKIVLIQHIFAISSLRKTIEEVRLNIAYRWFIGYSMNKPVPHFSTVSYNFRHRFSEETIESIFCWILQQAADEGFIDCNAVFVDGTHIKANANMKKNCKKVVPVAAKRYAKELSDEVNKDREAHGKKPFKDDDDDPPRTKIITESSTDAESGVFHKGEHRKCFAYEAHTACDMNNFVLGVNVTPGNIHDSAAFDDLYDYLCRKFPEHKVVVADSAYKTPYICKRIFDDKRILSSAYKRPMTKKAGHKWHEYVYDEYYDCVICPEYQILKYSTTNREGYREYKSDPKICSHCPTRNLCTNNARSEKTVTKHIWSEYIELAEDIRHTKKYSELYKARQEKIERVFADAKEKHGMRYTLYRGLTQVTKWVKLKFAAMNLKKLAMWKWTERLKGSGFLFFIHILSFGDIESDFNIEYAF